MRDRQGAARLRPTPWSPDLTRPRPRAGHRPGASARLGVRQQRRAGQLGARLRPQRRPGTSSPPTSRPSSTSSGSIPAGRPEHAGALLRRRRRAQDEFFGALPPFPVSPRRDRPGQPTRRRTSAAAAASATATCSTTSRRPTSPATWTSSVRPSATRQLTFAGYSYGGLLGMTYAQLFPAQGSRPGARRRTRSGGLDDRRRGRTSEQPFSVRVDSAPRDERRVGVLPRLVPGRRRRLRVRVGRHAGQVRRVDGPAAGRTDHRRPPAWADRTRRARQRSPTRSSSTACGARLQFPPIWAAPGRAPRGDIRSRRGHHDTAIVAPAPASGRHRRDARRLRQQPRRLARRGVLGDRQPAMPRHAGRRRPSTADRDAPYFGADWAWLSLPCATWPARDHDRSTGPFDVSTANPMLFINARFDAASPYERAVAGCRQLSERSPRSPSRAPAHPASFVPNECVSDAVARYIVEQRPPAAGAVCGIGDRSVRAGRLSPTPVDAVCLPAWWESSLHAGGQPRPR